MNSQDETWMDLRALLWGDEPDRRADAADHLERSAKDAAAVLSYLLAGYLSRAIEHAPGKGGPLDAFNSAIVNDASRALNDLADLADVFGKVRHDLTAALNQSATVAGY